MPRTIRKNPRIGKTDSPASNSNEREEHYPKFKAESNIWIGTISSIAILEVDSWHIAAAALAWTIRHCLDFFLLVVHGAEHLAG